MASRNTKKTGITWHWNIIGGLILSFALFQNIPLPHFDVPYSTLYYNEYGELLDATLAEDQGLRFPPDRDVPPRFAEALVTHLDQDFHMHPGINLIQVGRSLLWPEDTENEACTLTQSVIRLSRDARPQTSREHLIESLMALRLEQSVNKETILRLYSTHALFGGKIHGIEAATWHYFSHTSEALSWAEAATLAVLPQASVAGEHPRITSDTIERRNLLLAELNQKGTITDLTYMLAVGEPLVAQKTSLKDRQDLATPES